MADCSMTLTTTGSVVAATATIPASSSEPAQCGGGSRCPATDALGLSGNAAVSLTVDQQGPVVSGGAGIEVSPNNGTLGSGVDATSLKVYGTFSDAGLGGSKRSLRRASSTGPSHRCGRERHRLRLRRERRRLRLAHEGAYGLVPLTELTAVPDGPVTIYIHAKDAAGNWGAASPVTLIVDRTKPVVSGLTATQQAGAAGRVQLQFTLANPGTSATNVVAGGVLPRHDRPGCGQRHGHSGADLSGLPRDRHGDAAEPASRGPDGQRPGQGRGRQLERRGIGQRDRAHGADLQ